MDATGRHDCVHLARIEIKVLSTVLAVIYIYLLIYKQYPRHIVYTYIHILICQNTLLDTHILSNKYTVITRHFVAKISNGFTVYSKKTTHCDLIHVAKIVDFVTQFQNININNTPVHFTQVNNCNLLTAKQNKRSTLI